MMEREIQAAIVCADMWIERYGLVMVEVIALLAIIAFIGILQLKEEFKMGIIRRYEIESEDTTIRSKDYSLTTDENGNIVEVKPEEVTENAGNDKA